MSCAALALVASLASIHLHTHRDYNQINPGVSVVCNRYEAGAYYNSIRRWTIHADYRTDHFMFGVMTGYLWPIVPEVAAYKNIGPIELVGLIFPEFDDSMHVDNVAAVIGLRYKWSIKK